jgi:hypothetical protein
LKPKKLDAFMRMLMKEARRYSLAELLERWGISEDEYKEIEDWFLERGINI